MGDQIQISPETTRDDRAAALAGGASPSRAPGGRLEFANILRGVAAMSVIVAHLCSTYWRWPVPVELLTGISYVPSPPAAVSRFVPDALGGFGVALFFMISGFVIPFSLERYSVKGFVVGRLWRIWPTCWVGLTVTVCSVLIGARLMNGVVPFTFRDAITHYFPPFASIADSRPIDSVMWTLEIEMFFYIVCALFAGQLRRGDRTLWLAPLALFAFWFAVDWIIGNAQAAHPVLVRRLTYFGIDPAYIVFMFCGVALNLFQRGRIGMVGAAGAMAMCYLLFAASQAFGHMPIKADLVIYLVALALFAVCMAAQRRFRRTPLFRFLSDISYPIYIIHGVSGYIILHALTRAKWNPDLAVASTILFMIALAYAIHRFVEAPTHRIGQRLAARLTPARP